MKIRIDENYEIQLDRYAWSIAKWKKRKKDPDGGRFEQVYWFRTLSQACEKAVELRLAESGTLTLPEFEHALTRVYADIRAAIEKAGLGDCWVEAKKANHAHLGN